MARLGAAGTEGIEVSDVEFGLSKPSYTLHTVQHLKRQCPDQEFALIIGEDNLQVFDQWFGYEELLDMLEVYVYPRRNKSGDTGSSFATHPKVTLLEMPLLDISGTHIRDLVQQGEAILGLVPDKVVEYVKRNRLYC